MTGNPAAAEYNAPGAAATGYLQQQRGNGATIVPHEAPLSRMRDFMYEPDEIEAQRNWLH